MPLSPPSTRKDRRQIVVQKNKQKDAENKIKEIRKRVPEIQNRTLIKSLQANLNSSGLIYADKKDNLTISKDILYDLPP